MYCGGNIGKNFVGWTYENGIRKLVKSTCVVGWNFKWVKMLKVYERDHLRRLEVKITCAENWTKLINYGKSDGIDGKALPLLCKIGDLNLEVELVDLLLCGW